MTSQADISKPPIARPSSDEVALTAADYESLASFRYALRRFARFSEDAAREAGLTPHQHQALLVIKGHRGDAPTVGVLAERLLIAAHSAAELVARLEAAGLVEKIAAAGDRRRVALRLTARAEVALAALTQMHLREVRDLAPGLMTILGAFDSGRP